MAEMYPPYKELSAEAVLFEIRNSTTTPSLTNASNFQNNFIEFISRCLKRTEDERASAHELMQVK